MKESNFQGAIIQYLKKKGYYVRNYVVGPGSVVGTPDILACINGRFWGIEVKVKHKATPAQHLNAKLIMKAGGRALLFVHSKDWRDRLDKIIEKDKDEWVFV